MTTKPLGFNTAYKYLLLLFTVCTFALPEISGVIKILLIIALFINLYTTSFRIRKSYYLLWSLILICYTLLSVFYSDDVFWSAMGFQAFFKLLILGILLSEFLSKTDDGIYFALVSLAIAGGTLLLRIGVEFYLSGGASVERLAFSSLNANDIGLKAAICILAFLEIRKKVPYKYLFYLIAALLIGVIILTGSRKALFLLLVGIAVTAVLASTTKVKLIRNMVLVCMLLGISVYLVMNIDFLYQAVGVRLEGIVNAIMGEGHIDASTAERMALIDTGLKLWKESPVLGYGINTFTPLAGFGLYAHNNYIEEGVGMGIVGVFIWYTIYPFLFYRSFKSVIKPMAFCIILLMPWLDVGLVSYMEDYLHIIFAILFASSVLPKEDKESGQIMTY